jgi:hypothetical protein
MTTALLVLLCVAGFAMAVGAFKNTRHVRAALAKTHARTHLPRVISTLVLTIQFGELMKVIDHVSVTHIVGALLLLAVVIATKAGTEGELIP